MCRPAGTLSAATLLRAELRHREWLAAAAARDVERHRDDAHAAEAELQAVVASDGARLDLGALREIAAVPWRGTRVTGEGSGDTHAPGRGLDAARLCITPSDAWATWAAVAQRSDGAGGVAPPRSASEEAARGAAAARRPQCGGGCWYYEVEVLRDGVDLRLGWLGRVDDGVGAASSVAGAGVGAGAAATKDSVGADAHAPPESG